MWSFRPCDPLALAAVQTEAGRGGIAKVARLTVRALADAGTPVRVNALADSAQTVIDGVPARAACGSRARFVAGLWRDAIGAKRFIYDHAGVARAHPALPRRPYAVWMHGVEVWGDGLTKGRAAALRQAGRVLVNSHYTLRRFEAEHWPLPHARVCLLGTEDEAPIPLRQLPEAPVALTFGRVDEGNMRKGHREVVEAWPAVVAAVPDARLVLAGGGDGVPLLRELVDASPVRSQIDVLGFVPEADVDALWRSARLYVQPSWKEGFGLTYIEAMRYGIPVIASVNDAGQEINEHDVSGVNVDLREPDMLAAAVVGLLRDRARTVALGNGGRQRWADTFRFGAFANRLMAALSGDATP